MITGRTSNDADVENRRPVRLVVYDDAGGTMLTWDVDPAMPQVAPSWKEHDLVAAFLAMVGVGLGRR